MTADVWGLLYDEAAAASRGGNPVSIRVDRDDSGHVILTNAAGTERHLIWNNGKWETSSHHEQSKSPVESGPFAERYNGWTNYETWCVFTWLDNEETTQRYWNRAARKCSVRYDTEPTLHYCEATHKLADELQEHLYEQLDAISGMWMDLLRSSLERVNWCEIAQSLIDGVTG